MKRLLLFILLCGTFGTLHAQEEAYTTRLQPIVVKPGVNPAHRIIQNAINHRDQNNPEKNQSYRCIQYSKMTFHVAEDTTARRIMARSRLPFVQPDTSGYGLMVESVMERIFAGPGRLQEKVIASKTSGFKEYQQLAMLTAALQFFHFYDEVIEWKSLNQFYLNPISPNSTERYFFSLVDTLISAQGDSTFVIDFRPSRTSNMDGLKGTLHINSHGWAIERVVAEPATAPLFPIKMEQQYRLTDAEIWFPAELSVAVSYKNFALTGLDMFYYHKSWISEVTINPDLGGRKLAAGTIVVAEDAGQHSEYIARYRAAPLSLKEWNTYQKYEHANYDWVLQIAEGATDRNSFSVKTFDIPFNQVINYNYYEGWHFGMGLYTNRRLSPRFSVGGYGRYGLKDKEVKYGVSVSLYPRKDLDSEIKLWAQNDISDLSFSREAGILGVGRWGNFYLGLQGKVRELAPLFEYSYKGQSYYRRDGLGNAQASIQLRYSIREQRSKIFRRTYAIRSDFPVFYLNYTFGLPRLLS
ncbi:MAG: DUF5686 family protein, partial [Bacteroidetes bacterium]|nr:DUF5686 family protein [Bacteroidota bacterium]